METNNGTDGNNDFVVRIRGLPWQATREDIVNFFHGCKIKNKTNGVYMTLSREGRPSGEAYVEMENEEEFRKASDFHKKHMGSRYIEVFPSKRSEMESMIKRSGITPYNADPNYDGFVRLRGIPFDCKRVDLEMFFEGLEIVPNGIVLPVDRQGRATGEAYVQFATREIAEKAMGKHKDKIGHRYIEIFKSSYQEFRAVWNYSNGGDPFPSSPALPPPPPPPHISGPPEPYYNPSRYNELDWMMKPTSISSFNPAANCEGFVRLRGLPFSCKPMDIENFFSSLKIVPNGIVLPFDHQGRATGEAYVQFATREMADKAMEKHKEKIGHRYIEIFKSSYEEFRAAWDHANGRDSFHNSPPPPPLHHHIGGPTGPHYSPPHSNSASYPPPKMRYGIANRPAPYDRGFHHRGPFGGSRGQSAPCGGTRRPNIWDDPPIPNPYASDNDGHLAQKMFITNM